MVLVAMECCHWVQHYAATGGIPEELLILPPGAIQSCHLIRSGLDCQIPLSEAAWRLQSEKQAVRCGLPVNRPQLKHLESFCVLMIHCLITVIRWWYCERESGKRTGNWNDRPSAQSDLKGPRSRH